MTPSCAREVSIVGFNRVYGFAYQIDLYGQLHMTIIHQSHAIDDHIEVSRKCCGLFVRCFDLRFSCDVQLLIDDLGVGILGLPIPQDWLVQRQIKDNQRLEVDITRLVLASSHIYSPLRSTHLQLTLEQLDASFLANATESTEVNHIFACQIHFIIFVFLCLPLCVSLSPYLSIY